MAKQKKTTEDRHKTKQTNIRMPGDLKDRASALTERTGRPLNQLVIDLLLHELRAHDDHDAGKRGDRRVIKI